MFDPSTMMSQLLFSTVRIETKFQDHISTGTGFLLTYVIGEANYIFVVTNKHVIENSKDASLCFNLQIDGKVQLGNIFVVNYADFALRWVFHPDPEIDIAILPFGPTLNELKDKGIDLFFKSIPISLIPSEEILRTEIDSIEDVIFIGYPSDIYDKTNLIPIVRKGITATPITHDYERKPIFLIDASVIPGSSGSPVLICNNGSYIKRGTGVAIGNRTYLLGIISEAFITTTNEPLQAIPDQTAVNLGTKVKQFINLGIVYKTKPIIELIESYLKRQKVM